MQSPRTKTAVQNREQDHHLWWACQLNLRYGANIIADNTYKPNDSILISLKHLGPVQNPRSFPLCSRQHGNDHRRERHSGKVGRILEIVKTSGSVPNRIIVEDEQTKTPFDTIMPYIYVVGKDKNAISNLGVKQ